MSLRIPAAEIVVVLLLSQLSCVSAFAAKEGKKLIWGNIYFAQGANYSEFEAELSKTRAQARSELLGDLGSLLIPLAWSSYDVPTLAQVLSTSVLQFDELARRHAQQVHEGISLSLTEDFKSGVDRIYVERRLNDSEQRTGLAYVSRDNLDAMARKNMGVREALKIVRELRFLAYGSYTVLDRAMVRVVLNVEDLITSQVKSFSAEGSIGEVGVLLAVKVVDFLQGVQYPDWENPQRQLTWIAPSSPGTKVRSQLAAHYCAGQKARLPYIAELLHAAMGGNYREGGIGPLLPNATYIVADRNLYDEQYYYSTGEQAQMQTGGPIHTSAGHGTVLGYYWCVRGEPSADTLFNQAIYRLVRLNRQSQRGQIVSALEYVLAQRNDLGLESSASLHGGSRLDKSFASLDSALQFLAENGIFLQLPQGGSRN
jgi:hypothetical protein